MSSWGDRLLENYTGLLPLLWKAVLRWKERSQYEKLGEKNSWGHETKQLLHDHFQETSTMESDGRCGARGAWKVCSRTRDVRYNIS